MARDKTPDLMGDLLSGKKASKPAEQQAMEPASQEAGRPAEDLKLKRTFYLSKTGINALEELQYQLRRLASLDDRGQISYSLIVERAILLAMEELEAHGEASKIASRLLE